MLVPGSAEAQVSGSVRDELTGQPLAGARVSLQASNVETLTAADGSFDLTGASGTDLVITAAAKGYFIAGVIITTPATGANMVLEPVPTNDDPSYVFKTPVTCGICHENQLTGWTGSPMAEAGKNTWVHDIYNGTGTTGGQGGFVYTRDSLHATANPTSECAACHQPESWAKQAPASLGDLSSPSIELAHGVACDMCHRIADVDETRPNYPGVYAGAVTLARIPGVEPVMFGVLGDVTFSESGRMRPAYQPQLTAAVCGTCHQDKNDPDGDGDFEQANGVISEPTYLEWKASPYADPQAPEYATCVDCHMKPTNADAACDGLAGALGRPPGDIRSHDIRGTTPEYLENAVAMSMTVTDADDGLQVEVSIVNDQTGHSVPTGVTIRNMILVVEATRDADALALTHTGDQVVHELGGVGDPTKGYYAGLPGKLYGKVNHDATGSGPTFFTDATGILFDNRIEALATDVTRYVFEKPLDGGAVRVRARLIYRRSWRALVDAKGWTEDGHGNPLADVQAPNYGHLMEQSEQTLTIAAAPPPAEGCGCVSGTRPGAGGALGTILLACICAWPLRRRRGCAT